MDIEQSTKNFLENDFRFLTIGEVARELLESRAAIKANNDAALLQVLQQGYDPRASRH